MGKTSSFHINNDFQNSDGDGGFRFPKFKANFKVIFQRLVGNLLLFDYEGSEDYIVSFTSQ